MLNFYILMFKKELRLTDIEKQTCGLLRGKANIFFNKRNLKHNILIKEFSLLYCFVGLLLCVIFFLSCLENPTDRGSWRATVHGVTKNGHRIPWRRERLPNPVFWPGEFQGLHRLCGRIELDTTERLSLSLW